MKYNFLLIVVFLSSCFFISACEFINKTPTEDPPPNSNQSQTSHESFSHPLQRSSHQDQTAYGGSHPSQTGSNQNQAAQGSHQPQINPYQGRGAQGYFHQTQTNPSGATACNTNADCVLVNKDCCGCSAGGESIAIHRSQQNSYNSNLQQTCLARGAQMCAQWYRCGDFQVRCHNSQCVVTRQ